MDQRAYLDNHTTTRPSVRAVEAMLNLHQEQWGSLLSPHEMGQELYPAVDLSLKKIYDLLGAKESDQFYLMGSGMEAVSQVAWAHYFNEIRESGRNHVLTTVLEESLPFAHLEKMGCSRKIVGINGQGQLSKEEIEGAIFPRTSLLSLSWADGLTGVIQPLDEIGLVCREKNIRLHVDVSTVLGKLYFRFQDLNCDYLSFDGEKIHAPKGISGVFAKSAMTHIPNLSVPNLVALATSLEEVSGWIDYLTTEVARLRSRLEQGVSEAVVFFKDVDRLSNTTVIAFPGVHAEALLFLLSRKKVYAKGGEKLARILQACGVSKELSQSALSFSLSHETTEEEIEYALEVITTSVKKLRAIGGRL